LISIKERTRVGMAYLALHCHLASGRALPARPDGAGKYKKKRLGTTEEDREVTGTVLEAVRRYLSGLDPVLGGEGDLVSLIGGGSQIARIRRGETVCAAGAERRGCFMLLGGKVKLALLAQDGAERVMDVILPEGTFGEAMLWSDRRDHLCAEALADSELLFVSRVAISNAFDRHPAFARALMRRVCAQSQRLLDDLEASCLLTASERVERYLARNARRSQRIGAHGEVQLPASKSVVASSLNLSAETFSRELHRLAADALITIDRRTIHVHDIDALAKRNALRGTFGRAA
jgi:CRP-like cAMP-binding protein